MSGPCANYRDRNQNDKLVGYDAVGPGWRSILEGLDQYLNAYLGAEISQIKILQIKEKFGQLRIYPSLELEEEFRKKVYDGILIAEEESYKICENCGAEEGVVTRKKAGVVMGRILTLCSTCHAERDACVGQFEMGNGDKV